MSAEAQWWNDVEELPSLSLESLHRLCGESSDPQHRQAAIVRGMLSSEWLGWAGRLSKLNPKGHRFSLYTAREGQNVFSRAVHTASYIRSGFNLWKMCQGMVETGKTYQLRGYTDLCEEDLFDLVGPGVTDAFQQKSLFLRSTSIWSGSPGSRTPLHKDHESGIVFQAQGTKRFFLCSQAEIDEAVDCDLLPEAVRDEGSTDCFCVDGLLETVYGLSNPMPKRSFGSLAVLSAGDCLILPRGLYHDVECAIDRKTHV
eukprot:TRINITY_DN35658_c0_g1_i1.p1 TRINITY_DN35658_c0_g1~~TRINITY_DN35658_c0_g1_i1.p1  ORF type:complete len:257 (+),score=37.82 TRINITY_DN35658_c0_g1_i1:60-830(+)